jgi:sugar lactone lactonase YvrE
MKKVFLIIVVIFIVLLIGLLAVIRIRYGGGKQFEDRSSSPILPQSALKIVAALDEPPGNIAVSATGRIFITIHPLSRPEINKVVELIDGKPVPYPDTDSQQNPFQAVLGLAIDRQNRLWLLDDGMQGIKQPRLIAFDLQTDQLVKRFDFPSEIAGLGSFLNDLQIDPAGQKIYIADTSTLAKKPAIIVYDTEQNSARRVLENHPSVVEQDWIINAGGHKMMLWRGLFVLKPAVDSIALDRNSEWLYYGPMAHESMFRVRAKYLNDQSLTPQELGNSVEKFGPKPLSDGLSMDIEDNIYITDVEHGAILKLGSDRKLVTLIKDARLRWPDGLSFGPDHWLYISDSALQDIMFKSKKHIRSKAPYFIFKFKPGPHGIAGQ